MQLNYLAIFIATILQFISGAVWYTFLFGKLWGKIHGFDKLPKSVQKEMMSQMGPIYGAQFVVTLISSLVLSVLLDTSTWGPFVLAGLLWLGFIVPTQASGVFFGGTENKWIITKIAVLSGGSLVGILIAAGVFAFLK